MSDVEKLPADGGKELPPPIKTPRPKLTDASLILTIVAMLALLGLGFCVWRFNLTGDFALGNVLLVGFALLAMLTLVLWASIFAFRGFARLIPPVMLLLLVASPFAFLRIREVGGEMIPVFTWRFAPDPDELLEIPAAANLDESEDGVDLTTTTPDDFEQFPGPNGRMHVQHVELAKNWDANPPKLKWKQVIGAGWSTFAVVNGFAVTMEQRGPQELVTCYEVETGKLQWSHGVEARYDTILGGVGPRATPTIFAGRVYANGATGILRCLDGATGELIWQKDILAELDIAPVHDAKAILYGRSNSPLVYGNLVVVAGGANNAGDAAALIAFNNETGEVAWRGGHEQIGYATPVLATLDGIEQVVTVSESTVSGHDAADGHELWKFSWPGGSAGDSNNSQPIPLPNNRLFVSKAYGVGAAVVEVKASAAGKWNVEEIWASSTVLKTKFTNVVIHEGYAYGLSDGILQCVDVKNGESQWKKGRYHQGQVLGVGDVLLVMHETKGDVAMVELSPAGYNQLGKFNALDSTKVWNHLALYGNVLLVRDAQTMACWELPAK